MSTLSDQLEAYQEAYFEIKTAMDKFLNNRLKFDEFVEEAGYVKNGQGNFERRRGW